MIKTSSRTRSAALPRSTVRAPARCGLIPELSSSPTTGSPTRRNRSAQGIAKRKRRDECGRHCRKRYGVHSVSLCNASGTAGVIGGKARRPLSPVPEQPDGCPERGAALTRARLRSCEACCANGTVQPRNKLVRESGTEQNFSGPRASLADARLERTLARPRGPVQFLPALGGAFYWVWVSAWWRASGTIPSPFGTPG
jgi:hypothetical protein